MKNKFNIIEKKAIFFIIPAVMLILGICLFTFKGFNWDIDFTGGTTFHFRLDKEMNASEMDNLSSVIEKAIGTRPSQVQRAEGTNSKAGEVIVSCKEMDQETKDKMLQAVADAYGMIYKETKDVGSMVTDEEAIKKWYSVNYTEPKEDVEKDDEGTTTITVKFDKEVTDEIKSDISDVIKEVCEVKDVELKLSDDKKTVTASASVKFDDYMTTNLPLKLGEKLELTYQKEVTEKTEVINTAELSKWLLANDSVSAIVGGELKNTAILAACIAIVLMLLYISIRFEILSGLAAVIALAHDVFVMLLAYSLFSIPMNLTTIAAVLTILGYSINASIIVFDRIRENHKLFAEKKSFGDIVNISIWQTMKRSVNTTVTTLLPILMLCLVGVPSIRNFAIPILVGIVSGFYSSVFLVGPLWTTFSRKR